MSKFKGTPGEWLAVQHARGSFAWRVTLTPDSARGDIANILAGLGSVNVAADAKLIAAAPALLEALQMAMDHMNMLYPMGVKGGDALLNAMHNAIEKAIT